MEQESDRLSSRLEQPAVDDDASASPERDITDFMPLRRAEQKVTIRGGPYDPGGQPVLKTENKLLLGLFAWNAAAGCSITKAVLLDRDKHRDYWTWPCASRLIREAERVGLEFQLALGRWLGFGGDIGFGKDNLDSLLSTAALAQVTSKIALMSTAHIGFHLHPLHIARLGANFDHMSSGRWGLNIVAGWSRDEAAAFGLDLLDHNLRYEIADEFLTLLKHAWAIDSAFEFEGQFFQAKHVYLRPRPTGKPRPLLINAGYSQAGIDFAAKDCDWLLCRSPSGDWNEVRDIAERAKVRAAHNYGRQLKTLTYVYAVMAETDAQAQEQFEMLASMIDTEATDNFIRSTLDQPGEAEGALLPDKPLNKEATTVREMIGEDNYRRMALGLGGMHLVGSFDAVAEQLRLQATEYGQDGVIFSYFDPLAGIHDLEDETIPRLKKMALRE